MAPLESDEVLHARQLAAHLLDGSDVVRVHAHDDRFAVADHVAKIGSAQPVVERHHDRAELRHGVELLEHCVRVGRDDHHPIARLYPEPL